MSFGSVCLPSSHISLVTAASRVMSWPEITPAFIRLTDVSYSPISTLPARHCDMLTVMMPRWVASLMML